MRISNNFIMIIVRVTNVSSTKWKKSKSGRNIFLQILMQNQAIYYVIKVFVAAYGVTFG